MLTEILTAINFIRDIVYFCFILSYNTGRLIIHGLAVVYKFLSYTLTNVINVLKILLEDFNFFKKDLVQHLCDLFAVLYSGFSTIISSILSVASCIKSGVEYFAFALMKLYEIFYHEIFHVCATFKDIIVFVKRVIILFGSGVWFVLTLVPSFFVYLFILVTYYSGRLIQETLDILSALFEHVTVTLSDVYLFVTDVPLESLAGLITGSCILYILIKFHVEMYQYAYDKFERLSDSISFYIQSFNTQREQSRRQINDNNETSEDENDGDYRYCVICQERNKCMLFLPCKHVCVCFECHLTLRVYNRTCPICRQIVLKTMKVYV